MHAPTALAGSRYLSEHRDERGAPAADVDGIDYLGLSRCRLLRDTGNSVLVVGQTASGERQVAKFRSFAAGAPGEAVATSMVVTAAHVDPETSLPVIDIVSVTTNPLDATDFGWAYTMPFCESGSLKDHIEFGFSGTAEKLAAFYMVTVSIAAMHRRGIVHRDVKPSNLLYWRDSRPLEFGVARAEGQAAERAEVQLVVTDFDEACEVGRSAHGRSKRGTPPYCAPESVATASTAFAQDVWAMATIGIELFLSPERFKSLRTDADAKVLSTWLTESGCPPFLVDPIVACRAADPTGRPSAMDIASLLHENSPPEPDEDDAAPPRRAVTRFDVALAKVGLSGQNFRIRAGLFATLETCELLLAAENRVASAKAVHLLRERLGSGEDSLIHQFLRRPNDEAFLLPYSEEGVIDVPVPLEQVVAGTWMYVRALTSSVQFDARPEDIEELGALAISMMSSATAQPADCAYSLATALVVSGLAHIAVRHLDSAKVPESGGVSAIKASACLALGELDAALQYKTAAVQEAGEKGWRTQVGQFVELTILLCLCGTSDAMPDQLLDRAVSSLTAEARTHVEQLDIVALASWYLTQSGPLPPALLEMLFSPSFLADNISIQKCWFGIACLARFGELDRAGRLAQALLRDTRTALSIHAPFRASLEQIAFRTTGSERPRKAELAPEALLAQARQAAGEERVEEALSCYCAALDCDGLLMGDRIAASFELARVYDELGRRQDELHVYERFFKQTQAQDWGDQAEGAMQLAVNDLITRKQARSFGTLIERRATFEGLIPEIAKQRFPEPLCQLKWQAVHAFDALGRQAEAVATCDEILAIACNSEDERLRRLTRQVFLYKGATLCEMRRAADEFEVYRTYIEQVPPPADADAALERMQVWYYIAVHLASYDRQAAARAFTGFDLVAAEWLDRISDEQLGDLLIKTDPLRQSLLGSARLAIPDAAGDIPVAAAAVEPPRSGFWRWVARKLVK